jgi:hypothetical protein
VLIGGRSVINSFRKPAAWPPRSIGAEVVDPVGTTSSEGRPGSTEAATERNESFETLRSARWPLPAGD